MNRDEARRVHDRAVEIHEHKDHRLVDALRDERQHLDGLASQAEAAISAADDAAADAEVEGYAAWDGVTKRTPSCVYRYVGAIALESTCGKIASDYDVKDWRYCPHCGRVLERKGEPVE